MVPAASVTAAATALWETPDVAATHPAADVADQRDRSADKGPMGLPRLAGWGGILAAAGLTDLAEQAAAGTARLAVALDEPGARYDGTIATALRDGADVLQALRGRVNGDLTDAVSGIGDVTTQLARDESALRGVVPEHRVGQ